MKTIEKEDLPYCSYDACDIMQAQEEWLWERLHDSSDWKHQAWILLSDIEGAEEKLIGLLKEWEIRKDKGTLFCAWLEATDPEFFRIVDKAIENDAASDSDIYTTAYEDICECLTELMEEINPNYREWRAEGQNLGWQRRSGYKEFKADTGKEMLRAVLPNTDFTCKIYKGEGEIRMVVSHHDSMGECYQIHPVEPEEDE